MTVKEKLLTELSCAIVAVYGDDADKEVEQVELTKEDLQAIAKKVAFYLDL